MRSSTLSVFFAVGVAVSVGAVMDTASSQLMDGSVVQEEHSLVDRVSFYPAVMPTMASLASSDNSETNDADTDLIIKADKACDCSALAKRDDVLADCPGCFTNNIRQVPDKNVLNPSKDASVHYPSHTLPTATHSTISPRYPVRLSTPVPSVRTYNFSGARPFLFANGTNSTLSNGTAMPSNAALVMVFGGRKAADGMGPDMDITAAGSSGGAMLPPLMPVVAFWIAAVWALVSFEVEGRLV